MGHQKCSLQSARGPWAHCQALRRPTYVAAVHLQVAGGVCGGMLLWTWQNLPKTPPAFSEGFLHKILVA